MATWNLEGTVHHVLICNGGTCIKHGAEDVTRSIREHIKAKQADHLIHTTRTRCNGRCADGCVVIVYPDGVWYGSVKPQDAAKIVCDHLMDGNRLEDLCIYHYQQSLIPSGISLPGERKE